MNFSLKPRHAALALAALLCGQAHAIATTGSLAGWIALGDAVSTGGKITVTTAYLDGAGDQIYNLSGTSAVDASLVAAGAGIDISKLDLPTEFATEGSLVSQSFTAAAGQTLGFDWSFATHETLFLDNAFLVVGSQLLTLATTAQPGSGTQHYSFTFAQAGATKLSFGVVDTGDVDGVSALTIGNLQLSPAVVAVPEPATTALLLAGLGAVGLTASRRRKSAN